VDFLRSRLERHVQVLAGKIGERNVWRGTLEAAASYIEGAMREVGLAPTDQPFSSGGHRARNLEVRIAGNSRPEEILLVGAHYDTVPGSPGADDNASGIAALIEVARLLADSGPSRTLRLVAFANEEPPFFSGEEMGSRVYARRCRRHGEAIRGMICLETIGFFSTRPGSQSYPLSVLRPFYPDTGDFIAFVDNLTSRRLLRRALAAFRRHSDFPVRGLAAPARVPGVDWSDHRAFWQEGYPALLITDTAPFRYPHYHSPADTPEKLDYSRLAQLATGLAAMVSDLASC
jgi:Zn-dependent M28 family amino/carboxypeptidase